MLSTQVTQLQTQVAELAAGGVITPQLDPSTVHELSVQFSIMGEVGTVIALQGKGVAESVTCSGLGTFRDIDRETPVLVRDVNGHLIGQSSLHLGNWDPFATDGEYGSCRFTVPYISIVESPFYTIAIGNYLGVSYSLEEMVTLGWSVRFSDLDLLDQ